MDKYNLYDLLIPIGIKAPNIFFRQMKLDSRNIIKGDLFLAIKGYTTDGRKYISQVITQGASAVIAEAKGIVKSGTIIYINKIPIIYINNLNHKLSFLAGIYYQYPAKKLKLIGVTGTNGKTTITQLIAQWVKYMGEKSAVMGTIGNGILDEIIPSKNTTNSAIDIQQKLKFFVDKKVNVVTMEISSHSLVQGRVLALLFTSTVFSNLTHDHLDYHINMKNYKAAKWLLFNKYKSDKQIINIDDSIGLEWYIKLSNVCIVSMKNKIPYNWQGQWVNVKKVNYYFYGTIIYFHSSWGNGVINSKLIGDFNVSNIILAMATLLMMDYSLKTLISTSYNLRPINGRMEVFTSPKKPIIIVDYAHTPDALKKVLISIRLHFHHNKIWCVFGCGGNRDKGKRALMGGIAEKYSDIVIITDDNSRNEEPKNIINDILSGFIKPNLAIPIIGRKQAIINAITKAQPNDIVLISGKGHENYQIINKQKIYHSDRLIVTQLLEVI